MCLPLQVQNTARSIKSSLEAEDNVQMISPMTSSPPAGRTSQDKAADVWSSVFWEHSKSD